MTYSPKPGDVVAVQARVITCNCIEVRDES